ncbi:CRISPR-associated protein, Cmr3 family [Leptolyngbyaceae cyanobacterium JSC-12]|nr:CRISPR-associated protein, Cmr3 family [Leptolyngbyaceae cyanobacterium JSC-12]
MPAILVTIKTLQPILATSFQGDPNSDVSYDYIPGSMIRGAIIGRYLQQKRLKELDLADLETQRLFFQANQTRYLNAYLVSKQEQHRTLPVPRSWYKPKDAEISEHTATHIYDLSLEQDDEQDSLKVIRDQFCTFEDSCVRLYTPARRINIHNTRDRRKGRSSKREDQPGSEGAIFRYDALDAGQTFQSVILCKEQDVEMFTQLLRQPDLWLGGSRSAGYGHTQISHEIQDSWREFQPWGEEEEIDAEHLTITLLSDTVLRDDNGQPSADPTLIAAAINTTCGSSLPTPEPKHLFSSQTYIGGFNRKWGLPLPQVPAITAGTVVVFENATLTDEQVQQLHWQGIGDRRNEGFGRVAINWHRQASFQIKKPPKPSFKIQEPSINPTSLPLAQRMVAQLLRQKLDQLLKTEVDHRKLETGKISNSQLSRLQLVARRGLSSEPANLQDVRNFLNRDNLTKTALEQFQKTRFKQTNESFYSWLQDRLNNPQSWIAQLPEIRLSTEVEATVDDSLAIEYTLKLIMAVAKQAAKENQR